jgi:hypothetical protein
MISYFGIMTDYLTKNSNKCSFLSATTEILASKPNTVVRILKCVFANAQNFLARQQAIATPFGPPVLAALCCAALRCIASFQSSRFLVMKRNQF